HDHLGLRQAREGIEGEEARVARSGTGEPHVSGLECRERAAERGERVLFAHGHGAVSWRVNGAETWLLTKTNRQRVWPSGRCVGAGPPARARRPPPRRPIRRS